MPQLRSSSHPYASAPKRLGRTIRISTMSLLAAGALGTAGPAMAADVTNAAEFAAALNNFFDENIVATGTDIDLLGQTFTLNIQYTQFFGDGVPRTFTNGTVIVTGSTSDDNFNLLNIATDAIFDGDVVLNPFSRLLLFDTTNLSVPATVEADDDSEIQLYSFDGDVVTWDQDFFNKVTFEMNADPESISFSTVGPGTSVITGLPLFDAELRLDEFAEFEFEDMPQQDPTLQLGANLAGDNDVVIEFGTLDLNDFDFTIDSLTGAVGTEITLGAGTLTTGDEQDTNYAGIISGTGNLVKTGPGMFTLSGVNTYTGTTTVTDGVLIFEADQTGPTAVIIQNGGSVWVNVAQTGVPAYTVQAGGTLEVFADLADATTANVDGVLDFNNLDQTLASISGSGSIMLGTGSLTVGDANNATFSGVISGSGLNPGDGAFTKVGAGTLTLSGVNTYSGATTVAEGSLVVDGSLGGSSVNIAGGASLILNGDLSNTAPVTVAAGGMLDLNDNDETLGTILGGGDIMLGTATLTVGLNGANTDFGGVISETGNLVKQNSGTLTLSGAQTFTGTTTVSGGTLIATGNMATSQVTVESGATFVLESALNGLGADVIVQNGGTIFGTGTIADDLTNNGTVTFFGDGDGDTLTVNGDYTQGSTGVLETRLGSGSGLVVTGTANLDGTLNIGTPLDPAGFDIGATYQVLMAGATAGNFANVTDDFIFLDLSTNNVGGNVEISLARNAVPLASIARTSNQANVANVLDSLGAPTGNLDMAIDRIIASNEANALASYDDLAGAGAATVSTQLLANVVDQSNRVLDQINGVAPGTNRPTGSFSQRQTSPSDAAFDDADYLTLLSYNQVAVDDGEDTGGLDPTAWGAFYGGFGDQGDGAEGLDYTRYGLLIGLELDSAESDASYGLSLGVEQSEFDFNQDNGDVDLTSLYVSGYARMPFGEGFNFTVNGGVGFHMHESTRNILIGVTPTQANADFDSISFSIAAELSKSFDIIHEPIDPGTHPTYTSIEPFVRLDYSFSDQDGYSETGAGTAGLNVSSSDYDSTRVAAGVRVQHEYMIFNQFEATFQARGLVNAALSNSDSGLNVSFVGTPGSSFAIEGSDQDDVFGQIGLGLSIELDERWDIHFGFDQQISSDALGTLFSAGLSYEF